MPRLIWDQVGERVYENSLDRGVLYLEDGSGVPWNGLTSVVEKFDKSTESVYFDGMKVNDLVNLGSFAATMKAFTYPDEFVEIEGLQQVSTGFFASDQKPKLFNLSYRTKVSDDLNADAGYKIHVLYNIVAIPNDKTYATTNQDASAGEFEWNLTAIPEELSELRPTAHFVIDSRYIDALVLTGLEAMLYGSTAFDAALVPLPEFVAFIDEWMHLRIVDHGDGTWSAVEGVEGYITMLAPDEFSITSPDSSYLDADTYQISSTP